MTSPIAVPPQMTALTVNGISYIVSGGTIDVTGASPAQVQAVVSEIASFSGPVSGITYQKIASASFNSLGHLILVLTDGVVVDAGVITINTASDLIMTYVTGSVNAGAIPNYTVSSSSSGSSGTAGQLSFANSNNSGLLAVL